MKLHSTFKVTFNTDRYPKEDINIKQEGVLSDKKEKVDLEFELDEKLAGNFLFRFAPSIFKLNDYNVAISKSIILTKDNYVYIVNNTVKLLSDIHEGYFRIISMNKLNDIMEFDFNIPEDNDVIHEEFEDEE